MIYLSKGGGAVLIRTIRGSAPGEMRFLHEWKVQPVPYTELETNTAKKTKKGGSPAAAIHWIWQSSEAPCFHILQKCVGKIKMNFSKWF